MSGYKRRFWQGSTDHRGVPGKPGRVVTLIESQPNTTEGMLYAIRNTDAKKIFSYLDHREKGGYIHQTVTVICNQDVEIVPAEQKLEEKQQQQPSQESSSPSSSLSVLALPEGSSVSCSLYWASESNPEYLGKTKQY